MSFVSVLNEDGSYSLTAAGYVVIIVFILAVLLAGASVRRKGKELSVRQLVFSAMAVAMAMVTSMIKLFHMPLGGMVTLCSMLFVALIGYWYGLFAGVMSGIAFGLLNLIIDPYIISLTQMLTDYVFAFGALGLSGIFSGKKKGLIPGYITAVLGRYFFAVLSGVIFFGAYTPEGYPGPLVYSLLYNGAYIGAEALLTVIVLLIPAVQAALLRVKRLATE